MHAKQVMNTNLVTVTPDQDLIAVSRLMREKHVGFLVVVSQEHHGHPIGVITDRDVVIEVIAMGIDPKSIKVADVMTSRLLIAVENEDISSITTRMRTMGIRRVPVVSIWGKLVGIISFDDLLIFFNNILEDITASITTQRANEKQLHSGH